MHACDMIYGHIANHLVNIKKNELDKREGGWQWPCMKQKSRTKALVHVHNEMYGKLSNSPEIIRADMKLHT